MAKLNHPAAKRGENDTIRNQSGRAVNGQAKAIRKEGHTAALKGPFVDVLK